MKQCMLGLMLLFATYHIQAMQQHSPVRQDTLLTRQQQSTTTNIRQFIVGQFRQCPCSLQEVGLIPAAIVVGLFIGWNYGIPITQTIDGWLVDY